MGVTTKYHKMSKIVQAIQPKLEAWKPLLAERALECIENCMLHDMGLIDDYDLAVWIADNFPVSLHERKDKGVDYDSTD